MTANGYWVSFCSDESALKLIMVIVAQLCEYAEKYQIVKFNWVNCMLCTFYLNKVVFKKRNSFTVIFRDFNISFSTDRTCIENWHGSKRPEQYSQQN